MSTQESQFDESQVEGIPLGSHFQGCQCRRHRELGQVNKVTVRITLEDNRHWIPFTEDQAFEISEAVASVYGASKSIGVQDGTQPTVHVRLEDVLGGAGWDFLFKDVIEIFPENLTTQHDV